METATLGAHSAGPSLAPIGGFGTVRAPAREVVAMCREEQTDLRAGRGRRGADRGGPDARCDRRPARRASANHPAMGGPRPGFRERYAKARRFAHEMLHDELQDAIVRSGASLSAAYEARRWLMRRVPKKYGRLPPERRPDLLGALVEAHGCGRLARP